MAVVFKEPAKEKLKEAPFSRSLTSVHIERLKQGLDPTSKSAWKVVHRERGLGRAVVDVYRAHTGNLFFRLDITIIGNESTAGPAWYDPNGSLPAPTTPLINQVLELVFHRNAD